MVPGCNPNQRDFRAFFSADFRSPHVLYYQGFWDRVAFRIFAQNVGRVAHKSWGALQRNSWMDEDLDSWFMHEVLPLTPMLRRFLHHHWRDETDLSDLVQETLVRVYESARNERPRLPKSFIFMVARNLMIDKIRQKRVVSIDRILDFEWSNIVDETPSPEQHTAAREELRLLQDALDKLPRPCRDVVILRKIEGMSQRDVALRLGITEDTVEHLIAKGMRLLKKSVSGSRRPLIGAARRYVALETSRSQ